MTTEDRLVSFLGKPVSESSSTEIYEALLQLVKEEAEKVPAITGDKKVYYISAEFLIGKQLGKNLINLGLYDEVLSILKAAGKSIVDVERKEKEPSLGNGGLGRLAACFLDSIATLNLPGDGVGLNYHYGLFKQEFRDNKQYEIPDEWLDCKSMMRDTGVYFPVELGGKMYLLVSATLLDYAISLPASLRERVETTHILKNTCLLLMTPYLAMILKTGWGFFRI